MSNEMAESTEEKAARLQSAREELDELLTEQRNLPRELEGARREDHEERMQAASSGGRIRSALASLSSRVRNVEDRREALRHEIWSASIRVNELEAEHAAALVEDLEKPKNEAHREFTAVDEELPKLQRKRQDLLDWTMFFTREQREAERIRDEAISRAEALKKAGPE